MAMSAKFWTEVSPSPHPHEREALAFLRERLPDHEPYRAWSNFEFIAQDRSINEVDLLLLTPKGFYLVEIKSRPGIVEGDAGTWSWHHEGRIFTDDNPLLLANRKAKKLKSLLSRQKAMKKIRAPFLEPQVFLSHESQHCRVASYLREQVHVRDRDASGDQPKKAGVVAALTSWSADNPPRVRLDRPMAKAVTRAMAEAGIRPSQRVHKVGDYQLDELLFEGPTYRRIRARHAVAAGHQARAVRDRIGPRRWDQRFDGRTRSTTLSKIRHRCGYSRGGVAAVDGSMCRTRRGNDPDRCGRVLYARSAAGSLVADHARWPPVLLAGREPHRPGDHAVSGKH